MAFTTDNTEGYTAGQLDELNAALEQLMLQGFDEKYASDRLNNTWRPGVETADALLRAIEDQNIATQQSRVKI